MFRKGYYIIPCFILFLFLFSCSNKFDGKDGIKEVYFPNSEIIKQIVEYKNGKKNGELKEFYRNTKLKVKQYYRNDSLCDSAFFYHENGNIKYVQYLKNSKREGAWRKFNEQGQLYEEINFKDDEREGFTTKYTYRTGRLLQKTNYKDNMKEGGEEIYYNNGKPKSKTFYHYDRACVGTEEWYENGEKVNNEFKITIREQNRLLLENRLLYFIKLENPKPGDEVFVIAEKDPENYATKIYPLTKIKDEYLLEYKINLGGFVMETVKIAAFRKTNMNNTVIKTKSIIVSDNNF